MSLVFPVLLGGLALASVPILLHLIVRQKPKHLLFPAFRFLLQRHRTNQRKLRLRHLLLLALRVLLIVLMCMAVARPKLSGGRSSPTGPVAAILLFDTSPSMEYEVLGLPGRRPPPPDAKHWNLLDEARRSGLELLASLHPDSRVAVLDTTRTTKLFLTISQAENRIKQLKVRADSVSVTKRLLDAYDLLDQAARDPDEGRRNWPRFIYVFSDRTRGCWDPQLLKSCQDRADRVPLPPGLVRAIPERLGSLVTLLAGLGDQLQLSGGPLLIEQLKQLQEAAIRADEAGESKPFNQLLVLLRGQVRELLRQVETLGEQAPKGNNEYRNKLVAGLQDFLGDFKGGYEVFVDVGEDNPLDLAVERLDLPPQIDNPEAPRQVFWPRETFQVNAVVRATGAAYNPVVYCLVDGKKIAETAVKGLTPGSSQVVDFKVPCAQLSQGTHRLEVSVPRPLDRLRFDDGRYATFVVAQPRKILTVADRKDQVDWFAKVVNELQEFQCEVIITKDFESLKDLLPYEALCLFEINEPSVQLWGKVKDYIDSGRSVVVVPPADDAGIEDSKKAYNSPAAQRILPGQLVRVINRSPKAGVVWDWQTGTYQHPLLKPFQRYNLNPKIDIVKVPRRADRYWEVRKKEDKSADVLVAYADEEHHPALLETAASRKQGPGKVLLFTTVLDDRQGWNNYMKTDSIFVVMLPHLTFRYLIGSPEAVRLNFESGQPILVPLPLEPRLPPYVVGGPDLEGQSALLEVPKSQKELRVRGAIRPGNYLIFDDQKKHVAGFSVNVPAAKCDLSRVPEDQITALFGPKSLVPVSGNLKLPDALRYQWGQPTELLPFLLLAVLAILVVESLLANKFYRRSGEPPPAEPTIEHPGP